MIDDTAIFSLKGGNYYLTERENDAFRIRTGSVLIYIVPLKKEGLGRRSFIYEAAEGDVVPSFVYQDAEGCNWRFCFVALEEATIEVVENGATKVLRERFAQKANIKNYQIEGYQGSLIDQYRMNVVTEDGFIIRSQKERTAISVDTMDLIQKALSKDKVIVEKTQNALYDAMALLCAKQNITLVSLEKIKEVCGTDFSMEDISKVSNFFCREMELPPKWYKKDLGDFLVYDASGKIYACVQKRIGAYVLYDTENDSMIPVSKKAAAGIRIKAYKICRPLPEGKITEKDIVRFCKGSINSTSVAWLFFISLLVSLAGLLLPKVSQILIDNYIPAGETVILLQIGCMLGACLSANVAFSVIKNRIKFRLVGRISEDVQTAVYSRMFCLPESFYRKYDSADFAHRIMNVGKVAGAIFEVMVSSAIAVIAALVLYGGMLSYSGKLAAIGLCMVTMYAIVFYFTGIGGLVHKKKVIELEGKADSVMFQFLNGISKIRTAGVEDRAIHEYMKPYIQMWERKEKCSTIMNYGRILAMVSDSVFSVVLYVIFIKGSLTISLGGFLAFHMLFGAFSGYIRRLTEELIIWKTLQQEVERIRPLFKEVSEDDGSGEMPGDITGAVEINNVTFSYGNDMPVVLNNINLMIEPGEYVAIVGPSGCGKSTLLKLLLGFEKATQGKIYYDNKDIENLDKRELRKKMGVVLQEGSLVAGSILDNIIITAPNAMREEIVRVVQAVGLDKDLQDMPMGLYTVLGESCGAISGGQKQRILLARALMSHPKFLFLDEATSALDNASQTMVCETLKNLGATRIVIAHRLSTVKNCDRIIVMDDGQIVEQGTYTKLMEQKGLFYRMASRQII